MSEHTTLVIPYEAEIVGRRRLEGPRPQTSVLAPAITLDADGMHYFEHNCRTITYENGDEILVRCAPRLENHTRTGSLDSITIRASILCPDCGTHGFVTEGRWEPC